MLSGEGLDDGLAFAWLPAPLFSLLTMLHAGLEAASPDQALRRDGADTLRQKKGRRTHPLRQNSGRHDARNGDGSRNTSDKIVDGRIMRLTAGGRTQPDVNRQGPLWFVTRVW